MAEGEPAGPVGHIGQAAEPSLSQPQTTSASVLPQAAGATTDAPQATVADQVAESLRATAVRIGQQIVVRLNPPELGKVRLLVQADGNDLRAVVEVANARTLGELQRETPTLLQNLADSGVQVRRMELVLNDESPGDGTSSSGHDGPMGQQNTSETEPDRSFGGGPPGPELTSPEPQPTTQELIEVGEESINVWI